MLRSELRNKLESSEWTPDTVLISEKCGQLFLDATEIDCENTMTYLVAEICKHSKPHNDNDMKDAVSLMPVSPTKAKSDMDTGVSTLTIDTSSRSISHGRRRTANGAAQRVPETGN
ncbi:hypothetical protein GN244_ATG00280 [Phytophthora infestans]|uniref:Uncharacterized protein n=1 Tax=Phytophthora infestans TaxID=4787 RepID=A0A833T3Z2_PHYIN|nr:hypothetical protein GN244_ATG00280 [Phytophthora infestans]KAF4131114.1 hypothetical protein GN958_ATG19749 [Phytophthora infestans]